MSLPEDVTTCTVTFGKALSPFGTVARISGKVTMDRRIIHAATGFSLNPADEDVATNEAGDALSFDVPHVDQVGFLDPATQESTTHWFYTLTGKVVFAAGGKTLSFKKNFQPLVGQTNIDLDLVADGDPVPGVTAPTAAVLSVAGWTGTVTVDNLAEALGLGTAAGRDVGTTTGTVAAGDDSRITGAAQKSANLSDLADAPTARGNLGLGDAATKNTGTAAGTVAAGDDSRISGAAQKSQNLADLADAATARGNLGLGNAAVESVGVADGVAGLDGSARVPYDQLPEPLSPAGLTASTVALAADDDGSIRTLVDSIVSRHLLKNPASLVRQSMDVLYAPKTAVTTAVTDTATPVLQYAFGEALNTLLTACAPSVGTATWSQVGSATFKINPAPGKIGPGTGVDGDMNIINHGRTGDFTLRCTVTPTLETDVNRYGMPGVVFNYIDSANYSYAFVSAKTGTSTYGWNIYRVTAGVHTQLLNVGPTITGGTAYVLRIDRIDTDIRIYADSTEIGTVAITQGATSAVAGIRYGRSSTSPTVPATWADFKVFPQQGTVLNWPKTLTKSVSNPVVPKGAAGTWSSTDLNDPSIEWDPVNQRYVLAGTGYYNPSGTPGGTGDDGIQKMGVWYADSLDGPWTADPANPVLIDSAAGKYNMNGGLVWWRDRWIYSSGHTSSKGIASAISFYESYDLHTWTKYPEIFEASASGWDQYGIFDSHLRVKQDGRTLEMWYAAKVASNGNRAIGRATSTDGGHTWVRESAPVLTPPPFDRGYLGATNYFAEPTVYVPPGQEGKQAIVFYDYSSDGVPNRRIGAAITVDGGATWSHRQVLANSASGWDSAQVFDSHPVVADGKLYLFYGGGSVGGASLNLNIQIGVATMAWDGSNLLTEKLRASIGAPNGIAGLDSLAKLPEASIPDRLTASTLAQTYPTSITTLAANRLIQRGNADMISALARSRVNYEDGTSSVDSWASLTGWTGSGVQVSGGKVYAAASSPSGASKGISIPSTGEYRMKGKITLVAAGGGSGLTLIGFSNNTADTAPVGVNLIAIGFNEANQPAIYRGGSAGGASLSVLDTTPQAAGDYYVTATVDSNGSGDGNVSLVLTDATGSKEWRMGGVKRSTVPGTINNVTVWNSDSRATSGHSIGVLGRKTTNSTITPRTGVEDIAVSTVHGFDLAAPATVGLHVTLPASFDSRKPVPLVLYTHGHGGSELSVTNDASMNSVYTALLAAGYAIAASSQRGNNWGNQNGVDDVVTLYKYCQARFPVGQVFVLSQSMGGLSGLLTLTEKRIPQIAAWAGIYPVTNLAALYAAGTYASAIRTAYGIASDGSDYATKTVDHDPNLFGATSFRGLPMRFYASSGDTVVSKASNSDLLAAKVASVAPEATVVAHTGDHGDATAFQGSDLVAFFNRYRTT